LRQLVELPPLSSPDHGVRFFCAGSISFLLEGFQELPECVMIQTNEESDTTYEASFHTFEYGLGTYDPQEIEYECFLERYS
jgi:hypothetical protein